MRSSFAKSIYLGAAVLGLAGLSAVTTTTASAKSKAATITSDKTLSTDATKRNVTFTGTNALYTKPGTVKGAKVVATTTTTKNLNKSTSSHNNFRAYRVAKTNRGSIYYKVVSYNKVYRGWVYGGKSADTFAGGLTSYNTFKEGTLTADQKAGTYKLTNPGKTAAGLTYKQPAWTQYKIGKTIADTTAYKDATFSITAVGTRTREGDTWVKVANNNTTDTKADGWILLSNLTQTNAMNEQSQVKVVVKDLSGNTLKSFNYTTGVNGVNADATAKVYGSSTNTGFSADFNTALTSALSGTGYSVDGKGAYNVYSKVVNGQTVTLYAKQGDQVPTKANIYLKNPTTAAVALATTTSSTAKVTNAADAEGTIITPANTTDLFKGTNGASFTADAALAYLKGNSSLKQLVSPSWDETVDGKTTTYHYVYTPSSASAGVYGTAFDATYTATKTAVTGSTDAGTNGESPITNAATTTDNK
ncbi:hypothetical protein LL941_10265 [Levilactobacillus brevis]|uniref:hypothetical protein n=1 Tax=Levilactobacillus brevis TaxID=1580 RepID=UPI001F3E6020|nr:hypothetical protein [Levilactobacillus brevis]MCE6013872.1 hypothetical protein [Levilactobacillus brevis]MCE6016221.1 hypothetical protein [Levilactobacillus brevis]MCE6018629.1 hypothetical protein [Levilactobacillus brevis]